MDVNGAVKGGVGLGGGGWGQDGWERGIEAFVKIQKKNWGGGGGAVVGSGASGWGSGLM